MFQKSSGILMHISSLPSQYGIGDFGQEAYRFVDFLVESNQKLWQILPMGPTGYGDSPYQSFSAFAGNPYFIDLEDLVERGLLEEGDLKKLKEENVEGSINYGMLYNSKFPILRKAFEKFNELKKINEMKTFEKKHSYWLEDYTLFMAIKGKFDQNNWQEWPHEYKFRDVKALEKISTELKKEMDYFTFLQYIFYLQWDKLKSYANVKGIKIIGDIPIFVSPDSADAWSKSEMFLFDEEMKSVKVAGCPPDAFSVDGQLWGNPLYDWKHMDETGYKWWIERIRACFELHDIVRIDHFRGFESYWAIPAGSATAVTGAWEKGPGMKLFNAINKALGDKPIIAEDLGFLTPEVEKLLKDSTYPGMKILLFAFDSKEENDYLPHKYPINSVAYTGTHDNMTVLGWYREAPEDEKKGCHEYLDNMKIEAYEINWKFIEAVWETKSQMVLTQTQDLLGLDNSGRMNTPSTSEGNWQWRLKKGELDHHTAKRLTELTRKNGR